MLNCSNKHRGAYNFFATHMRRLFEKMVIRTNTYLNTLLDKYIPKGRSANGTRGPMQGTPPIRHIDIRYIFNSKIVARYFDL